MICFSHMCFLIPRHPVTPSHRHVLTPSRRHVVTPSPRHLVTPSRRHPVTPSRRHVLTPSRLLKGLLIILTTCINLMSLQAQISPGDLSNAHAHLEGISNCTQCHVLGEKVSNEKCLKCHTDVQSRISLQKGYHSSTEVKGKECLTCHSEHNGKNFHLIRLDIQKFDHKLTGYDLSVPHAKKECRDCHAQVFIPDQ